MVPRLRFLRPYCVQPLPADTPSRCSAYLRFYELARADALLACRRRKSTASPAQDDGTYSAEERSALMAARLKELRPAGGLEYPRLVKKGKTISVRAFQAEFETRAATDLANLPDQYTLCGRVLHVRRFGAKFYIVKIMQNGSSSQALVNLGKLTDGTDAKQFKAMSMLLKRGDHISVTGRPARSESMELSIEASHSPQLLSPSIAPLPFQIPQELKMHNRHIDLLLNRSARDTLLVRAFIVQHLRDHLHKTLKCVEVQTPILAANAGGAVARPFSTHATEFIHKDMSLRIAPELWLKRLVVGGLDRVFEIGPSFRNEGVDATHNPEFTTCEFYLAYTNLDYLLDITQNLMVSLAKGVSAFVAKNELQVEAPDPKIFENRFQRIEFVPALEEALGQRLPNLDSPRAVTDILNLLKDAGKDWHKSLPPNPSLAKLLDHMAAAVIEPKSRDQPLYITNHPVCMSPLAKSFTCPTTGQQVAARAELFYGSNELANMYEEENDPFKQKRKFMNQAKMKLGQQGEEVVDQDEDPPHVIDEQYISVLESGLPPTGGWGCGVDRLVMLFTGSKRISEVLPFGNLRNVVGLASGGPPYPREKVSRETTAAKAQEEKVTLKEASKMSSEGDMEQASHYMGFSAFSAASFLSIAEDVPETNTDDGISERIYKRYVSKIIEQDPTPEEDCAVKQKSPKEKESQDKL